MALLNLETYYSFPNIDWTNNSFKYSQDNGEKWFTIQIPEGNYKIRDIQTHLLNSRWEQPKMKNTSFLQYFENGAHTVEWLSGGLRPTQLNEACIGF